MEDIYKASVDIVYCVDLTYCTTQTLDKIKNSILALCSDLNNRFSCYNPYLILKMKIKMIGYSNGFNENNHKFEVTDFFSIPEEGKKLKSFLNNLEIRGNKGRGNRSLEALCMAMQSDWSTQSTDCSIRKMWNCIVLVSGASQSPFVTDRLYSNSLDFWYNNSNKSAGMDQHSKRLVVIAPKDSEPWSDIADDFDFCWTRFTNENNDEGDELLYFHNDIMRFFLDDLL